MKNKAYILNSLLAIVVGIAMLAIVLVRTFLPQMIIPRVSIPNIMALCLIALMPPQASTRSAAEVPTRTIKF